MMAPVQRLPMSSTARWKREQTLPGESVWIIEKSLENGPLDTRDLLKYTSQTIVSPARIAVTGEKLAATHTADDRGFR